MPSTSIRKTLAFAGIFFALPLAAQINPDQIASSADTRPKATTSVIGEVVSAGASCEISVSPSAAPGAVNVGACASGSAAGPGTITHVHLSIATGSGSDYTNVTQNSSLTFLCDGYTNVVPFRLFFMTQDNPTPFYADNIASMLGSHTNGTASVNRRTEINFTSGCTVTFNNGSATSSVDLFADVDYKVGASVSRSSRQQWHAYYTPLTALANYAVFPMLAPVIDSGGGELESMTLFGSSPTNGNWMEGYCDVTVDGNVAVTANGTEDCFGSGYFGINAVGGHWSPKWGEFYATGMGSGYSLQSPYQSYDALLYRFFNSADVDNVIYTDNLEVTTDNGESSKPLAGTPANTSMASLVTYWTHDLLANAAAPTYSPTAGGLSGTTSVTLSSATGGATICSTTDGSIPVPNGAGGCTYGASGTSVTVNPPATVTAVATEGGYLNSLLSTAAYTAVNPFTFKSYGYASNGGSSSTTVTSTSISVTAGDFIYVHCGASSTSVTMAASSSQTDSFGSLTHVSNSSEGGTQDFYVTSAVGGSTTFKCTFSSTTTYGTVIALDYSHTGGTPAFVTGTDLASGTQCTSSVTTCTSGTFSTSNNSLVVFCGSVPGAATWTAGTIGGVSGTLRGSNGSSFSGVSDACEDAFVGIVSGATAGITGGPIANWDINGAAFH